MKEGAKVSYFIDGKTSAAQIHSYYLLCKRAKIPTSQNITVNV